MPDKPYRPPRDNLFRALSPGAEVRHDEDTPRLVGHFARFNEWNEIDSWIEGHFMERITPGAFARTMNNKASKMPVLFQHGHDPELGDKVIATTEVLREDEAGPYFEARLLEGLPPLVESGLREGRYGVSYRFRVLKEDFDPKPKRSNHNPDGLPERTIREAEVFEFGPVTFPADPGADIAVRSLTDAYTAPDVIREMLREPERVQELIELRPDLIRNDPALASAIADALPDGPDADSHSDAGTRDAEEPPPAPPEDPPAEAEPTTTDPPERGSFSVQEKPTVKTIEEVRARIEEINARFTDIHNEHGASRLPDEVQTEWDALKAERDELEATEKDYESRMAVLKETVQRDKPGTREGTQVIVRGGGSTSRVPSNIYAIEEYRNLSRTDDEMRQALNDGARKAVEIATPAHEDADESRSKAHIERLLQTDRSGRFAQHILATGNPTYMRAFGKLLAGKMLTDVEARAVATVGSTQLADGGYAVPFTLDPTIILTSNGQVNPLRQMARVITLTTGNTWKGVTSAGVSISRVAEETAVTDTSPALAQPSVTVQAVKAEIKFSIESDEDWPALQSEMARLLQDAKDAEEAEQFINGNGNGTTGNPEGVAAGLAASSYVGTTGNGLTVDDLFRLTAALPDRFEPNAQFLGHRAVYGAIRQFGTGSNIGQGAVWADSLQPGQPATLLGYPARNASAMEDDYTSSGNLILLFGDFSNGYVIVDKVGLAIEIDPHVRDGDGKWTGQRALLAHYRNNAMVLVDNALRALKVGVVTS